MNQVSWTRQLGLAALLLALGTFAYWAEYKHKPEKEAAEEQSKKLFVLDGISIQSIRLSQGTPVHPDVVLKCLDFSSKLCKPGDQAKWQITDPTQLRADDSNVNSLISTLNRLTSNETISLKDETPEKRAALLKDYGLDSESLKIAKRIEVTTEKGSTTLFLGSTHPIGDSLFAIEEKATAGQTSHGKVDDAQVYLVPNYFKSNLEHDLAYWRDKKLLTLAAHEIDAFQIEGSNGTFSGDRTGHPWTLKTKGQELPGDSDQISSLLTTAAGLTAKTFVADHKTDTQAQTALKGASRVLTLTLHQEKGAAAEAHPPLTIALYRKKTGNDPVRTYATVSNADPLYEVESNVIDRIHKRPFDLRQSRLLTSAERFNSKKLEFSGKPMGSSPLRLALKDGKWKTEGDSKEIDSSKVQLLLDRLSASKAKDFLTGSNIPQGEAEGLTLKVSDDKESHSFILWKKPGTENLYVKDLSTRRAEVIVMDSSVAEVLPWTRDAFKNAEPKPQASASPEKSKQ